MIIIIETDFVFVIKFKTEDKFSPEMNFSRLFTYPFSMPAIDIHSLVK